MSGEVIAFTFGRCTHATFRHLKKLLTNAGIAPDEWLTDQWGAYQDCLRTKDKAEL